MAERFADVPSALENTLTIAQRCNVALNLGEPKLPDFPTPEGMSLGDYLRQLAAEGMAERLQLLYPDEQERAAHYPEYKERLDTECDTIIEMGVPGYFLIVADFINWGKENGVLGVRGGGAGGGSMEALRVGCSV